MEKDDFVFQADITNVVLQIDQEQGSILRDLISENYPHTMPHYCRKVGIPGPNFYNLVNGRKPCSLEQLNKLLSGIGYRAIITNPEIRIQEVEIGEIVTDVDSIILDDESLLNDAEDLDMPN